MKIQFLGAAQTVTGSRTLVSHRGYRTLVDCGLFQGARSKRELNWKPFTQLHGLNSVVLTHAHIDHSGFLPKLAKDGFDGPVFSTKGTYSLCRILLPDSAHLQVEDAKYANETGHSRHKPALPLYDIRDAEKALKLFKTVERNTWNQLSEGISLRFVRSGHIIGSSYAQFSYQKENGVGIITFTGDIGNGRSPTLNGPEFITETDYLVIESTYGNRIQPRNNPLDELASTVNKVCSRGGVLLIPAFSVGRTQDILYLLRQLEEKGRIPNVPVFLDSPMSIDATRIFQDHPEDHRLLIKDHHIESPLCPNCFETIVSTEESQKLTLRPGPMIVISAAGMLSGGRILHHLKTRLPDPKNGVLFVGYQAEETKGRVLLSGVDELRIHHAPIKVRAELFNIDSLSAHADLTDLLKWIGELKRPPKKIFINHGEHEASLTLSQQIQGTFGYDTVIPEINSIHEVN